LTGLAPEILTDPDNGVKRKLTDEDKDGLNVLSHELIDLISIGQKEKIDDDSLYDSLE
jgi:hypothetical protein